MCVCVCVCDTEASLTDEVRALIGTLKKSTAEGDRCVCVCIDE